MTTIAELEEGDLFYLEASLGNSIYGALRARPILRVCRERQPVCNMLFVEARAAYGITYWLGENRKVVRVGRHES